MLKIKQIKTEEELPYDVKKNAVKFKQIKPKSEKQQQEDFYKDFIASNVNNKKWLEKQVIYKLYQIPKKDLNEPTYKAPIKDSIHQIDTLFLPKDGKNQYCLCVIDVHTRLFDIEPMSRRSSDFIVKTINKIYNRKPKNRSILNKPIQIICDAGTEFGKEFKIYCKEHKIHLKVLKAGKKIGIIDSKMKILTDALMKRLTAQEIKTKKYSVKWTKDLTHLLDLINQFTKKTYIPKTDFDEFEIKLTRNKKYHIIPIGTKVRTALFVPIDVVQNKTSHGIFRSGDIRWSKPKTITNIILRPNSPIMYSVDNDNTTLYTREKLQIITKNEIEPPY